MAVPYIKEHETWTVVGHAELRWGLQGINCV